LNQIFKRFRSAFVTGVLVIIPILVTWWGLVTLYGAVNSLQPEHYLGRKIPGLGVAITFMTIMVVGFLAQNRVGKGVLNAYEWAMARVPVVSSIQQGVKQLVESLFATDRGTFQQVVLIEYPRRGIWCVAFHTGQSFVAQPGQPPLVNVFLPTTPNPTSGFYLMIPEADVHLLDLSVEEAFKLIMSAGIVAPDEKRLLTQEVTREALEAVLGATGK